MIRNRKNANEITLMKRRIEFLKILDRATFMNGKNTDSIEELPAPLKDLEDVSTREKLIQQLRDIDQ